MSSTPDSVVDATTNACLLQAVRISAGTLQQPSHQSKTAAPGCRHHDNDCRTSQHTFARCCCLQTLMARIKRDNAAVEQMTSEAKQLQGKVKQLEARQGAAASTAAAAGGASVIDDPVKR